MTMGKITIVMLVFIAAVFSQISVSPRSIELGDVSVEYEEAPFVPIVFFDGGSSDVHSRFDETLRELAERIAENPDVIVEIRGYYHKLGDGVSGGGELCRRRAESVRKKIISFQPDISERVIVQPAVDPTKLRRGDFGSREIAIQQENQRAEITARIEEPFSITLSGNNPKQTIKKLKKGNKLYRLKRLLTDNPLFFVLIEGVNIGSVRESSKTFEKLMRIRNALAKELGENYLSSRIFVALRRDEISKPSVKMSISTDWVIHKPIYRQNVSADNSAEEVKIDAKKIKNVKILREDGEIITDVEGKWKLSAVPEPMWQYFASSLIRTPAGHYERIWSKPISFEAEKNSHFVERFVVGNFKLSQLEALDYDYAYAQLFTIARKIVQFSALNPKGKINVKVLGYTDDTGDDERNRQMTQLWADREIEELKRLLQKPSLFDIDGFKKMCEINYSSTGMKNADKDGRASSILMNENNPEGRVAKRRVEIFVEYQK